MKKKLRFLSRLLLSVGLLLGRAGQAHAQKELITPIRPIIPVYREKLRQFDALLQQPLRNNLVTEESYAKALGRKQVALTGLSVQRGQTLGTSATAGDKSASFNLGLTDFKVWGLFNAAVIANTRFNVEQGFVKLLSDDDARLKVGYGGTLVLFGQGRSLFHERDKKDFHYRLRKLRRQDKADWGDSLVPHSDTAWQRKYTKKMVKFVTRWRTFQQWMSKYPNLTQRFYEENGKLEEFELDDTYGEQYYLDYLDAEHAVKPLLPRDWDKLNQVQERSFIRRQIGLQLVPVPKQCYVTLYDTLQCSRPFLVTLEQARNEANEAACQVRYQFYDSLQQRAPWSRQLHQWVTASVFYNNIGYPVLDTTNKAGTYAGTYDDHYWQTQLAYNVLFEGKPFNLSLVAGIGTSDQLAFRATNQLTYQTATTRLIGTDTVMVVRQKSLYPSIPERVRYLNLHAQLTATLTTILPGFGFTGAYEVQLAHDRHGLHNITLGVIMPVRAGTTTVQLIPQVRARGIDAPDRWSFGFTLTAAIPSLLVNTLK